MNEAIRHLFLIYIQLQHVEQPRTRAFPSTPTSPKWSLTPLSVSIAANQCRVLSPPPWHRLPAPGISVITGKGSSQKDASENTNGREVRHSWASASSVIVCVTPRGDARVYWTGARPVCSGVRGSPLACGSPTPYARRVRSLLLAEGRDVITGGGRGPPPGEVPMSTC
ncbi:hypothetical protein EYF80_026877 [Liparis tanakae]|uniref:Uncharacterized protein n=1 Tax=Liparis tanakae TaxID=230148 RepID=A0A4Z2HCB5_9TELE|nr:hypothetical protein EYF80_026877 [Liparis tanakae]